MPAPLPHSGGPSTIVRLGERLPSLPVFDANAKRWDATAMTEGTNFRLWLVVRSLAHADCRAYLREAAYRSEGIRSQGVDLVVLSTDPVPVAERSEAHRRLRLRLGCGLTGDGIAALGVHLTMPQIAGHRPLCEPALFALDRNAHLRLRLVSNDPRVRPDIEATIRALQLVQMQQRASARSAVPSSRVVLKRPIRRPA